MSINNKSKMGLQVNKNNAPQVVQNTTKKTTSKTDQNARQIVTINLKKNNSPSNNKKRLSTVTEKPSSQNSLPPKLLEPIKQGHPTKEVAPEQNSDPTKVVLDNYRMITLNGILEKPYIISGKDGAAPLKLNLSQFLAELYQELPEINISLIGSTVGHIFSSKNTEYDDIDFLIEMDLTIEVKSGQTNELRDQEIANKVKLCGDQIRVVIERCLATQLNRPKAFQQLKWIGENYFNGQSLINSPINWDDLPSSNNRCSIIRFGDLEFKTVVNICLKEESKEPTIVPGLKHSCAFRSDSLRIPLPKNFLNSENKASTIPLIAFSVEGTIDGAVSDLKDKKLQTHQCDGSKCIKGNGKITFNGYSYSDNKTNQLIHTAFLASDNPVASLKDCYNKLKSEKPLGVICAFFNFLTNGSNLEISSDFTKDVHAHLESFIRSYFSNAKDQKISQELLLKWCHLTLMLSSESASHNSQLFAVKGDQQSTYYLVKPNDILKLLFDCVDLLKKETGISIGDLPAFGMPFKTIEELLLKVPSLLDDEQRIIFNHFLLSNYPSLSKKAYPSSPEMLYLLLKVLATNPSPQKREKLIESTQAFLKLRRESLPEFFEALGTCTEIPSISSLFLMCIREMVSIDPVKAKALFEYAKKQRIFGDSAVDELEAFTSLQKVQLEKGLSKDKLISLLKETNSSLNRLSKMLTSEDINRLGSLHGFLQPLLHKLSQTDLSLNELQGVLPLYSQIKKYKFLSNEIKDSFGYLFLGSILKLIDNKKPSNKAQDHQWIVTAIQELLLPPLDESTRNTMMRQIVCSLRASPQGLTIAKPLFSIPGFVSMLIEGMKEGSLGKNINWFTALYNEKRLKQGDKIAEECCETLLMQWRENPNVKLYKQVVPALDFFRCAPELSKKGSHTQKESSVKNNSNQKLKEEVINTELQDKLIGAYTNFVHGCIKSKDKTLLDEAANIVCNGIKLVPPSVNTQLICDLICKCNLMQDSVHYFIKAIKGKDFSGQTDEMLLKVLLRLYHQSREHELEKIIVDSDQLINFVISQKSSEANSLIVDLLTASCFREPSSDLIDKQTSLFKRLYENRNNSTDHVFDTSIREITNVFIEYYGLEKESFSVYNWIVVINALIADRSVFSEDYKQDLERLISLALGDCEKRAKDFIVNNCDKELGACKNLLDLLSGYLKMEYFSTEEAYEAFLSNYMISGVLVKRSLEALRLMKERVTDYNCCMRVLRVLLKQLGKSAELHTLYSIEGAQLMDDMLSGCVLSKETQKQVVLSYCANVTNWVLYCQRMKTFENGVIDRVLRHLLCLIQLMKQQLKSLETEELDGKTIYKNTLRILSKHVSFHMLTQDLLDHALKEKVLDAEEDSELIAEIKLNLAQHAKKG